ncbi:hypothetical protein POG77_08325 [Lactococcus petauri]|uniref:hypothetical protein n=1 Tax=Lactococcus TaxID=1357 RepID=UPI0018E176DC|nr:MULTISPECIES: hypothetical protein [Lactococcus]USI71066.1 hypothetical protein LMJ99_03905 [Lactococcus garvieae subsp. garvieae]MDC0814994.1 hypothetical protein [Lactococcus petauri]MDC0817037.1 hypothetical protein [Lactococcus petauri]MDC0824319.1 hypothetical protein [Lactococcus petauri]MDC0830958.1 hypothetical protein [Lactococcus petauri]
MAKNNFIHELSVENGTVMLDGRELKAIQNLDLHVDTDGLSELKCTIYVNIKGLEDKINE